MRFCKHFTIKPNFFVLAIKSYNSFCFQINAMINATTKCFKSCFACSCFVFIAYTDGIIITLSISTPNCCVTTLAICATSAFESSAD